MLRKYKKGDFEKLNRQPEQMLEGNGEFVNEDNTFVIEEDGKVLVIGCPFFIDNGCYLATLISRDCGYKGFKLMKFGKRLLKMLLEDNDFVEITTQVGWLNAERLARLLGFKPVRLIKEMYNGIDFNVWRIEKCLV